MNFLQSLFNTLFGRNQPQASAPAPAPAPKPDGPYLPSPQPSVQVQQPQPQGQVSVAPSFQPSQLVKVGQPQAQQPSIQVTGAPDRPQPVTNTPLQAAQQAVAQTGQFVKAIGAPIEGVVNLARDIPALGYGALGALMPGHTFQGNVQAFNKAVPEATFADNGAKNLTDTPGAQAIAKAGEIAGGMAVPIPGTGEIKALQALSPAAKIATNAAIKSGEGAAVGGAFGLARNGDIKEGESGAALGAGLGLGGSVLGPVASSLLSRFRPGEDAAAALEAVPAAPSAATVSKATSTALETTPGLTSVNPDRVNAVKSNVIATLTPKPENPSAGAIAPPSFDPGIKGVIGPDTSLEEAQRSIPAFQRAQEANPPVESPAVAPKVGNGAVTDLTGATKTPQQVQDFDPNKPAIPSQVNVQPIGSDIRPPFQKSPVTPVPLAKAPEPDQVPTAPEPVVPQAAPLAGNTPEIAPEPPKAAEIQQNPAPSVENPPPAPNPQPVQQAPSAATQADAAPRLREAVSGQLKENAAIPKSSPQRDVLVLKDLAAQASAKASQISDGDLASMYMHGFDPASDISNPRDFVLANASLDRLYQLGKDGNRDAATAAENALKGMQSFSSKNAQYLSATRVAYENMPLPMKIDRGITQLVNRVKSIFGPDSQQLTAILDPAKQASLRDQLGVFFQNDKDISDRIATVQQRLDEMKATPSGATDESIGAAKSEMADLRARQSQNVDSVAKFIDQTAPAKKSLGESVSNFIRNSMLSGLSGRLRHVTSASFNTADEVASSKLAGAIGSVANKVSGQPGKFIDSGISASGLVKALPEAAQKIGSDFRGDSRFQTMEDLDKAMRSDSGQALSNTGKGVVSRGINAAVQAPARLTEGISDENVRMLARQEGEKAGFQGDDLENYTKVASVNPSPEILAKAQQANEAVNNLNKNPVSTILSKFRDGIASIPGVGKPLARLIEPFPTYTGATFWNAVTDRNVLGNTAKMAVAIAKGDPQEAINQFAKGAVHGVQAAATGYILAKSGLLTTTDANGKSYDGLYLHVGDRYMPVGIFGALAPNMIMGFSAYNAYQEHQNGTDIVTALADQGANLLKASAASFGSSNITDSSNALVKAGTDVETDPAKAGADLISGTVGGAIPSIGGDINSVLNQTALNPTHEAADTTVVNPNSASGTAADPIKSAIAGLENKIPGISQTLPRNPGVSSQDFVDRITQGNHTSPEQAQAASDQKTQVASAYKGLQDHGVFTPAIRGILDPAGQKVYDELQKGGTVTSANLKTLTDGITKNIGATGDSRFLSNGDYESNLTALQVKYDTLQADPTTTQKDLDNYQEQIARAKVYQKQDVPYSQIKQYENTTLNEWRNMGDSAKPTYDPAAYQALWNLDQSLAKAGGSLNSSDPTQQKFSAVIPSSASRGSGAAKAITSNTLGTLGTLKGADLSKITGKAITGATMPKIAPVTPGSLIKMRSISVGPTKA